MKEDLVEKIAKALNPEAFAGYGHAGPQRDYWEFQKNKARDRARAVLAAIEADGKVIVPREPTAAMLEAPAGDVWVEDWHAIIAVAEHL